MIKIEKVSVYGLEEAIRGMRNPMNSWNCSDSYHNKEEYDSLNGQKYVGASNVDYCVGYNDNKLMMNLAAGGPVHAKYHRMITVYLDITAPLYWWKEFDTDDFSHEHLDVRTIEMLKSIVDILNDYRDLYVNYNTNDFEIKGCPSKKDIWWQMIQLLPSSYNQKRTVMLNYEVLVGIYRWRKEHKLDEWREFCRWIEQLPYSEIIIGEKEEPNE